VTPRALLIPLAALLVGLAGSAGCGYHVGFRPRPGVRSVAVPIFENKTFRRELEIALTEAVVREIQQRTPLRVDDIEDADLVVEGTILDFRERVAVEGPDDEVLESVAIVTVGVRLRDRRTGRVIAAHDGGLPGSADVVGPPLVEIAELLPPQGERAETLRGAAGEAFRDLAARIVFLLERPTLARRVPPLPGWIPLPPELRSARAPAARR
jgi:hypothetical protein